MIGWRSSGLVLAALLGVQPVAAQQTCQEIEAVVLQCPTLEGIAGDPPTCFCEGQLVESLELSCAVNFGCATGEEIGVGEWPACDCLPIGEVVDLGGGNGGSGGSAGAGGAGTGGGLGGVQTCEQFFECPAGFELDVQGGRCICDQEMLPQFEE